MGGNTQSIVLKNEVVWNWDFLKDDSNEKQIYDDITTNLLYSKTFDYEPTDLEESPAPPSDASPSDDSMPGATMLLPHATCRPKPRRDEMPGETLQRSTSLS